MAAVTIVFPLDQEPPQPLIPEVLYPPAGVFVQVEVLPESTGLGLQLKEEQCVPAEVVMV